MLARSSVIRLALGVAMILAGFFLGTSNPVRTSCSPTGFCLIGTSYIPNIVGIVIATCGIALTLFVTGKIVTLKKLHSRRYEHLAKVIGAIVGVGLVVFGMSFLWFGTRSSTGQPNASVAGVRFASSDFSFVGPNDLTLSAVPGTNSTGTFELNVFSPSFFRVALFEYPSLNGTETFPVGTSVTVSFGGSSLRLPAESDPFSISTPPLNVNAGVVTVHYDISVPKDTKPGSYRFAISLYVFKDNSAAVLTYANAYRVNLLVP